MTRSLILMTLATVFASACSPVAVRRYLALHDIATTPAVEVKVSETFSQFAWVDLGHGVYGPPVLLDIRRCESGGDYTIQNRSGSSARGAYQFLTSTWRDHGHAGKYGVVWASMALPWQQDEAALLTWLRYGTSPWNASKGCWQQPAPPTPTTAREIPHEAH